jgi:hypothetical protein
MGETGSVLIAQASWSWLGTLSRAGGRGLSSVKLLLSPGADFIKFRVEPSDFGIQFDETQAGGHHQLLSLYASINPGGRPLSRTRRRTVAWSMDPSPSTRDRDLRFP